MKGKRDWHPPFPRWKTWVAQIGRITPMGWVSWERWRAGKTTEPTMAYGAGAIIMLAVVLAIAVTLYQTLG